MGANKPNANERPGIQCVEVLISKNYVSDYHDNIFWTLSVYSLENQPVKKDREVNDFEIFHFMVYDWKRTIKRLLDDRQIPYSVIQHFSASTVYPEIANAAIEAASNEAAYLKALGRVTSRKKLHPVDLLAETPTEKQADLMTF